MCGGILEDPATPYPEDMFRLTTSPEQAPDRAQEVVVTFEQGIPVAIDEQPMPPGALVEHLNRVAGTHGIGRIDLVENRLVGMKSRGVYETPAGTVLAAALTDLEALTLDRQSLAFKQTVGARYADLVYNGLWHLPLREAFDAFLASTHLRVSGRVTMRLFKGHALAVARTSPFSLYRNDLATFEADEVYDQKDAAGFIRLWGLPTRVLAAVDTGRDSVGPGAGGFEQIEQEAATGYPERMRVRA